MDIEIQREMELIIDKAVGREPKESKIKELTLTRNSN